MTTGPSREYVQAQLESAVEALSDARYLLEGGRLKAAANRAYYAMFYAAQAALAVAEVDRPRTHSGVVSLFGLHYVGSGRLDRTLGRSLQDVYDLHRRSDYQVQVTVEEEQVSDAVSQAETFVRDVKSLLEQANSE